MATKRKTKYSTLKGPLSVLNSIPGTYLSQTGNPLKQKHNPNIVMQSIFEINDQDSCTIIITHNSIQHKHKGQSGDEHKALLAAPA